MNCYQLSCGHWQSEAGTCSVGDLLIPGCTRCNALRSVVIGLARAPQFAATGTEAAS